LQSFFHQQGEIMVREVTRKPPAEPAPAVVHPYSETDPIPVAKAIESDTDTTWALWESSIATPDGKPGAAFEKTVPAELLPATSAAPKGIERRKEVKFDRRKSDNDRRGGRKAPKG
jgi:hypothetical protein